MPYFKCVDEDLPKNLVNEIKETFVFREGNVYNKKTGRQLKRYVRSGVPAYHLVLNPLDKIGFVLYFKLKGRVIDYPWANLNLQNPNPQ
jgi:hypothetical protein